jgi:hypothetical protein
MASLSSQLFTGKKNNGGLAEGKREASQPGPVFAPNSAHRVQVRRPSEKSRMTDCFDHSAQLASVQRDRPHLAQSRRSMLHRSGRRVFRS